MQSVRIMYDLRGRPLQLSEHLVNVNDSLLHVVAARQAAGGRPRRAAATAATASIRATPQPRISIPVHF